MTTTTQQVTTTPGEAFYRATRLPVFQNQVFRTRAEAEACATGNLELAIDPATKLICNQAFEPELVRYGADYHNEQELSPAFQRHLEEVAAIAEKHFAGQSLVEVGCGKGHFLEMLQRRGFSMTGADPAYEGDNPAIVREYFTAESGLRGDAIILRHVLEHVQNPVAFLMKLRDANGGRGKVYIEVPCFDWICEHRAWFDIFYEHVNYFRLSDFARMFGTVHEAGHLFHGQYLYAVADLATIRTPAVSGEDFALPTNFNGGVERFAERLKDGSSRPSAIWGAGSKGVIFALYMSRAGAPVSTVIDINPAKQGGFLPVTGLPIVTPESAMRDMPEGSDIFVMNSNYLQEIRLMTGSRYNYIPVDETNL